MPLRARTITSHADAAHNRKRLREVGVFMVNVIGGLGSGKTTLVRAALGRLAGRRRVGVVSASPPVGSGHAATEPYATAAAVLRVATGRAPWLTAAQVRGALDRLPLDELDVLLIENLGCRGGERAAPDLGQDATVCVLSVVADDDDEAPGAKCDGGEPTPTLVVFNKIDLRPMLGFEPSPLADGDIRPGGVIETSALTGTGVDQFVDWLLARSPDSEATSDAQ